MPRCTRHVVEWLGPWAVVAVLVGVGVGCGGPDEGADDRGNPKDAGTDGGGMGVDAASVLDCTDVTCHANATCDDSGAEPTCACDEGYTGDGVNACDDVDECDEGSDDCHANASCRNTDGAYACLCDVGYEGDGKDCSDFDECDSNRNTCDPNATCSNSDGSFGCACDAGTDGDGFGCADVNECANASDYDCATNASCVNTFGGYDCECDVLYAGDGKNTCTDLCEIALADTDVCDPHAECRITNTGAVCDACELGYLQDNASADTGSVGDGKKRTCVAEGSFCPDLCDGDAAVADAAHAVCVDPDLGGIDPAECQCAPGYSGDPGSDNCTDIDECATNNGGCGDRADCVNTQGGFTCDCKTGWKKDDKGSCVNVNECTAGTSPCHPNATCTDESPGFTCACKAGYEGDGSVCKDIDECKKGTDDCADGQQCINTAGSFECSDVDECSLGTDDCDDNATCTNTNPDYSCACNDGFMGNGKSCVCDLSGYWAMRQDVVVQWDSQSELGITTITCGCMKTTVWELHKYDYDGAVLTVEKKGCGQEDSPDLVAPIFGGETYSSYIPFSVYDDLSTQQGVDVPLEDAVPGTDFVTPTEAAVVGIKLDDPVNDTWPANRGAVNDAGGGTPEWDDLESDGQPGLTLWPRTTCTEVLGVDDDPGCPDDPTTYDYLPVSFSVPVMDLQIDQRAACVSAATRVKTHLEGEVDSCTRLVGDVVNESAETRIHSCTLVDPSGGGVNWRTKDDVTCNASDWSGGMACDATQINFLDAQNQSAASTATFELVKIADLGDDEPTCGEVRTELPGLGARACASACSN